MRHLHNLSHEHKLSTDMGWLVPIATMEVLPGDSFIHQTSLLARVAPLATPVMHDVEIRVHHWYVTNRILWDDWEEWILGDSVATYPEVSIPASASDYQLLDHMGIVQETSEDVSLLPIRAYNKIWNEFYRDQDLSTARTEDQLGLARISWEKDYFTTARDVPQQGDAVTLGFSAGEAPVLGIGIESGQGTVGASSNVKESDQGTANYADSFTESPIRIEEGSTADYPNIRADLSQMTGGIDINDLRMAMALQSFAEVRTRFGSRYVDYLRYLGVNPGDSRLQRPEFLGGGSQRVNFSEVLATAEGTSTNVGDLYGHGIAGLRARRYRRRFPEHGWVLSLLSARPKTVYTQGIPRKFQRNDPMEYWQKELEVLPWQTVANKEIYAAHASPDGTFGYVPRFDDYRHEHSYVSGTFRPGGTEESFHMSREFSTDPTLNESFVTCTPTDRIYSDTSMPELLINCDHDIKAKRLVRSNAKFGGPMI